MLNTSFQDMIILEMHILGTITEKTVVLIFFETENFCRFPVIKYLKKVKNANVKNCKKKYLYRSLFSFFFDIYFDRFYVCMQINRSSYGNSKHKKRKKFLL